jgi:hypothetical protein
LYPAAEFQALVEKGLTDERLLELYFGLEEGDLKIHPEGGYAQAPDRRYDPIDYSKLRKKK